MITDGWTYSKVCEALKQARQVEMLFDEAERLMKGISLHADHEPPRLDDARADLKSITEDMKEALDNFERKRSA